MNTDSDVQAGEFSVQSSEVTLQHTARTPGFLTGDLPHAGRE